MAPHPGQSGGFSGAGPAACRLRAQPLAL